MCMCWNSHYTDLLYCDESSVLPTACGNPLLVAPRMKKIGHIHGLFGTEVWIENIFSENSYFICWDCLYNKLELSIILKCFNAIV